MISAVVLTKNNQNSIARCIKSINWADEILVIDDFSTDSTIDIAQKYGAKILQHHLDNNFAQSRNSALDKAKGDWVMFIDSDEEIGKDLQVEIQKAVLDGTFDGYFLKRKDFFFGKWLNYGETGNVRLLRLGRKNKGKWLRKVHEKWEIKGPTSQLKNPLSHYPHPTIAHFLKNINDYSTLHAQVAFEEGKKTNYLDILLMPTGKFLKNYIILLGFLDGVPGLIMALMMSFHSFLSQAKLWQRQQKKINL